MFYTPDSKKNISYLLTFLACMITSSSALTFMITHSTNVPRNQKELHLDDTIKNDDNASSQCISNEAIIKSSTLLFLNGLIVTELLKDSSYNNTYKTGALMQLFGGWGLLFGSDNILSNTPLWMRIFATLYYYTRDGIPLVPSDI